MEDCGIREESSGIILGFRDPVPLARYIGIEIALPMPILSGEENVVGDEEEGGL